MHKIVYRSRFRFLWLLLYLGIPGAMLAFVPASDPHRGELWLAVGILLTLFFLPVLWTFKTKLELSTENLTICEGVFTLSAPWKDIRALVLVMQAEGAVLNNSLPTRQARRLRFWAKANQEFPTGALKGGIQRHRWIREGLFIPLQAFGYRVRSPEFQRELLQRAPHVELWSTTAVAAEQESADRSRNIWTFGEDG